MAGLAYHGINRGLLSLKDLDVDFLNNFLSNITLNGNIILRVSLGKL